MKSKRFEALRNRPINKDGFVLEWEDEQFARPETKYKN